MRDLFPGFYERTEEELSMLWQEATFVFDTNMLLNVYRYTQKTRDRYFEILDLLKNRSHLWIPYQVAYEYQDRRMDVIRGQLDPYTKVGSILQTTWQTLDSALEPYKSKHGFIDTTELAEQLISAIKNAKDTVTQSSDKYKQNKKENEALKKQDKLLEKLENLFQGNIGIPYSNSRLEELYRQAQLRLELRIPPGWKDEGKNSFKSYGDIVIWFQLIDYARTQKKPITFVTDDGKKDWWVWDTKGKPIKPLPALVQEMYVEAGILLHMYQGFEFLEQAEHFLKLEGKPEVIEEAKEVTQQNSLELDPIEQKVSDTYSYIPFKFNFDEAVYKWLRTQYAEYSIQVTALDSTDLDFIVTEEDGTITAYDISYTGKAISTSVIQISLEYLLKKKVHHHEIEINKLVLILIVGGSNKNELSSIIKNIEREITFPPHLSIVIGYLGRNSHFYYVDKYPKDE